MIATGRITGVRPAHVQAELPGVACGDAVTIFHARRVLHGTVTEVHSNRVIIAPFGDAHGVAIGDSVEKSPRLRPALGTVLLGRAIDAQAGGLDGRPVHKTHKPQPASTAPRPDERRDISEPLWTGIRAIDGLLTIGRGARIGIFGAPGLGKTTLIEMLVAYCGADATVVALVGERGREAERWLTNVASNVTIVCATSDTTSYERINAAELAMAQACALRARGLHVLLVIDSIARYAGALREARVAAGEPVGRAGYPASVFQQMARLVECAGATRSGSVTLIATVLSDGDERDPVSDAARSLLDGHIQLSGTLANAGRFPAIDVLASSSRTMAGVTQPAQRDDAAAVRAALAALASCADARAAGMMPVEPAALRALAVEPILEAFLRQASIASNPHATLSELAALADTLEEATWTSPPTSLP